MVVSDKRDPPDRGRRGRHILFHHGFSLPCQCCRAAAPTLSGHVLGVPALPRGAHRANLRENTPARCSIVPVVGGSMFHRAAPPGLARRPGLRPARACAQAALRCQDGHAAGMRRCPRDTMGGQTTWCAILCACVPSGCFLPSRADLPSLARLPLVSRGVFIAGIRQARSFNGEETMTAAESAELAQRYDPRDVQEKWQARWAELDPFRASEDPADTRERFYLVDMFPYPSGDLHMGHAEAYAIGDALARYQFLRGPQRAAPDRLGRLRPARGERRHQEQLPPGRLDLRQHRDAGGLVPAVCHLVRLEPAAADLRSRPTTAGISGCSCGSTSAGWPTGATGT